jgi:hypothetical protein
MTTPAIEPRHPTALAVAVLSVWVLVLALPMLQGQWLVWAPLSDQYAAGYAYRSWGSAQWRALGHVPLWNPNLFGGLPFVGAGHGDIFYPTSFLRLILPVATVMNLGFVLHYLVAGVATYALLRRLQVSWAGSVVGGLAYQMSGLLLSYPLPGHDGKLFAATALPLGCLGLVLALRERRLVGYPVLAVSIALALLGHVQMAYYLLIATGLFALYLTFGERREEPMPVRLAWLAGSLAAVLVGFGLSMIQLWPFLHFVPFGTRAQGYGGYADATSYAIPWNHVPEFFLANFVGNRFEYWGSNPLKYHSEYLGLPVIALAVLGAADSGRRRLVWWAGGIGLLFLLVSMAGATPFYRLWYAVMPMVKKTRAAGMAFYIVAFVMAVWAGLGVQRLERGDGPRIARGWLVAGLVVAGLALAGAFGGLASALAPEGRLEAARGAAGTIRLGGLVSGVALALLGALVLVVRRRPLPAGVLVLGLAAVVGGDLWSNGRRFWVYSAPPEAVHRPDQITQRIQQDTLPYRVFDLSALTNSPAYPTEGVVLMAHGIPQLLGHHAHEIQRFDDLMGGRGQWRNVLEHPDRVLDLFAVDYIITPQGLDSLPLPGFRRILTASTASSGSPVNLFARTDPAPYARVVPAALKADDDDRIIPTLMDPRMPFDRIVLLDPEAPVSPPPITGVPEPSGTRAAVTAWRPGEMTITLDPAPAAPSYLLIAENWFPEWDATVDGRPAQLLRGNYTMLTVALPAGARSVSLAFRSGTFRTGKLLTLVSLAVVAAAFAVAPVTDRRRRG